MALFRLKTRSAKVLAHPAVSFHLLPLPLKSSQPEKPAPKPAAQPSKRTRSRTPVRPATAPTKGKGKGKGGKNKKGARPEHSATAYAGHLTCPKGARRQNPEKSAHEACTYVPSLGANSTIACRTTDDKSQWTTQFCNLIPFEAM